VIHRFEVVLTEGDLVEAMRLTGRRKGIVPVSVAIVVLLSLLGLIFALSPQARYSAMHNPLILLLEGALGILLLLVGAILLLRGRILRGNARRTLAQRPDLAGAIAYEISAETFRHTTKFSDTAMPWSALHAWQESERAFLLHPSEMLFYAIPKSQASPDAIAVMRAALIAAKVRQR